MCNSKLKVEEAEYVGSIFFSKEQMKIRKKLEQTREMIVLRLHLLVVCSIVTILIIAI